MSDSKEMGRPPTPIDPEWLREEYLKKRTPVAEIAAQAGCGRSAVWRALRRHGIPVRGDTRPNPASSAAWLQARLDRGATYRDMAAEAGVAISTIHNWIAQAGLAEPPETAAELRRWYAQGLSIEDIARRMGISVFTARRDLHAAGVKLRNTHTKLTLDEPSEQP